MAASGECVPAFTAVNGSFKCCNTSTKNMKVVIQITDVNGCLNDGSDNICISDVQLANGQDRGDLVFEGSKCTQVGGTVTVYLLGTHSCTVNLLVTYSINGGPASVAALQSSNIPSGNTAGDCMPKA